MSPTPQDDLLAAFTPDQCELFEAMSEVSEISYAAGWNTDNEHAVWRLIHEGGRYGQEIWDIADPELERVRRAMRAARCWITWTGRAPKIVTVDEWAELSLDYPVCGAIRPGTLGYQRCVLQQDHSGPQHRSQDHGTWSRQAGSATDVS